MTTSKRQTIALSLLAAFAVAAVSILMLTGCGESKTYPTPDHSFESQWTDEAMETFLKGQGAITKTQAKIQWLEAYEKGLLDQANSEHQGNPLLTFERGDENAMFVFRRIPFTRYDPSPEDKAAWDEMKKQQKLEDEKSLKGKK